MTKKRLSPQFSGNFREKLLPKKRKDRRTIQVAPVTAISVAGKVLLPPFTAMQSWSQA